MLTMRDTHTAFDTCHPAVPATYFAGTILIAIFAMQPVCVGIRGHLAHGRACVLVRRARVATHA